MRAYNAWIESVLFEPSRRNHALLELGAMEAALPKVKAMLGAPVSQPLFGEGLFLRGEVAHQWMLLDAIVEDNGAWLEIEQCAEQRQAHLPLFTLAGEFAKEHALALKAFSAISRLHRGQDIHFSDPRMTNQHYANAAQVYKQAGGEVDMQAFFKAKHITVTHASRDTLRKPEIKALAESILDYFEVPTDDRAWVHYAAAHLNDVTDALALSDSAGYHVAMLTPIEKSQTSLLWTHLFLTDLASFQLLDRFLAAESEKHPDHLLARTAILESRRAKELKSILAEAGLLDESIFTLCNAAFGPERGKLMELIRAAVTSEGAELPPQLAPIQDRITAARQLITTLTPPPISETIKPL